jgi:hypothetical protein
LTELFRENFPGKNFGENFSGISENFGKFWSDSGKIRVFRKTRFAQQGTHPKILVFFGHFCHFFDKNRRKFRGKIPPETPRKIGGKSGGKFPGFFRNPVCAAGYPAGKSGGKSGGNFPEIPGISENFRKFPKKKGQKWPFLAIFTLFCTRVFVGTLLRSENTKKTFFFLGTFKNPVFRKNRFFPPRKIRFFAVSAHNRGNAFFRGCVPMVLHRLLPYFHILYNSTAN